MKVKPYETGPRYKIAILAVLASLEPSYSIAGIVAAQIKLLVSKGHQIVFITTDDFSDKDSLPEGVEVRTYPRFYGRVVADSTDPDFGTYVALTSKVFRPHLADCYLCLTHDVIFLQEFLPVNWAMRRAAEDLDGLRWLHWIHSGPSDRPKKLDYPLIGCFSGMKNSNIVYVNRTDVPRVSEMFDIPEADVRVVSNFVDVEDLFDLHPLTREIVKRHELLASDVICVYPTRLTSAKQPDKIVKLLGHVKKRDKDVRLIFCNSYSNAPSEKEYIAELRKICKEHDLSEREVIFTSEFDSAWAMKDGYNVELGVPRRTVTDLMRLSDLFILPSLSEGCSLIMLEAAISKNLMVLNDDLFSLQEFGGQKANGNASERAIYFSFGSVTRPLLQYNPSEEAWLEEHANAILAYQLQDPALQFFKHVRKRYTPEHVYYSQLEPLLRNSCLKR